jgi:uncharacterized phiE125 gp8 family phage protein
MRITLIKAAELDFLGLDEVKHHLRIDHEHEDEYLKVLIRTATNLIEDYLERSLLMKTWCLTWHVRGGDGGVEEIPLPKPPLVDVEKVSCLLPNGTRKSIRRYSLDTSTQQTVLLCIPKGPVVEIIYQSGYSETPKHVPAAIHQAALLAVADLYENRMNTQIQSHSLFQALLQPYMIRTLE